MAYGNLAYKQYQEAPIEKKPQLNKANKRKHEQMLIRRRNICRICATVLVSFSAGFMISQFVAVNETKQEVRYLQENLEAAESATAQKMFELEHSVDLATIEKEATTRLGMQRPERYQTIYVNVKQGDVTEKVAGEVEGLHIRLGKAIKEITGNIVEFFSIE